MKYFRIVAVILLFSGLSVFSQEKNIKHSIVKGETISSIAEKYKVSAASIYKLNPKAKKTLQLNQVLLIPNLDTKKTEEIATTPKKSAELNHEVLPKETLYGITKQYKTTSELLYKANPQLETEGLKIGQTIIIPTAGLTKKEIANLSQINSAEVSETTSLMHKVKPKESLYAIAKDYGITFKELKAANPKIEKKGLSVGQMIVIPSNGKLQTESTTVAGEKVTQEDTKVVAIQENKEVLPIVVEKSSTKDEIQPNTQNEGTEVIHEVLPKETKYGIAKNYGITVATLEKQNPAIEQKLLVGSKLNVRVPNSSVGAPANEEVFETKTAETNPFSSMANEDLINQLIQTASVKIGTRYRSGGTTNAGFDCSGLMCTTFGAFDISLPRSSIEQSGFGTKMDTENAQKGDLIFFKTNGRSRINHVGLVIDVCDGEIKFIHSSVHNGVIISSTKEPYYERNFVQVNRVIK